MPGVAAEPLRHRCPHVGMASGRARVGSGPRWVDEGVVVEWGLGVVAVIIWILLLIFLGVRTLRRGHWVMFIVGLFLPIFWLIGALIPPTLAAQGRVD